MMAAIPRDASQLSFTQFVSRPIPSDTRRRDAANTNMQGNSNSEMSVNSEMQQFYLSNQTADRRHSFYIVSKVNKRRGSICSSGPSVSTNMPWWVNSIAVSSLHCIRKVLELKAKYTVYERENSSRSPGRLNSRPVPCKFLKNIRLMSYMKTSSLARASIIHIRRRTSTLINSFAVRPILSEIGKTNATSTNVQSNSNSERSATSEKQWPSCQVRLLT